MGCNVHEVRLCSKMLDTCHLPLMSGYVAWISWIVRATASLSHVEKIKPLVEVGHGWQLLLHKVVLHPVLAEQTALMSARKLEVVLLEVVVVEDCHEHPHRRSGFRWSSKAILISRLAQLGLAVPLLT